MPGSASSGNRASVAGPAGSRLGRPGSGGRRCDAGRSTGLDSVARRRRKPGSSTGHPARTRPSCGAVGRNPFRGSSGPIDRRWRPTVPRQSPTVMSRRPPPLTARMVAARRNAAAFIVRPAEEPSHNAANAANPSGSRIVVINATRFCGARGVSTQPTLGRITSAQIRCSTQTLRLLDVETPHCAPSGRSCASNGRHQSALPRASAPLARHRCCHVAPGWLLSQVSNRA